MVSSHGEVTRTNHRPVHDVLAWRTSRLKYALFVKGIFHRIIEWCSSLCYSVFVCDQNNRDSKIFVTGICCNLGMILNMFKKRCKCVLLLHKFTLGYGHILLFLVLCGLLLSGTQISQFELHGWWGYSTGSVGVLGSVVYVCGWEWCPGEGGTHIGR